MTAEGIKYSKFNLSIGKKLLNSKRGLLLAVAYLFVAVVIAFIVFKLTETKKPVPTYADLLTNVNKDTNIGQFSSALKTLNAAPSTEKNDLLKVSVYLSEGNYKNALNEYQQIMRNYGSSEGLLYGAARAAENAKNYQVAINYYKQALNIMSQAKNDPLKSSEIAFYNSKIQQLEKLIK